MEPFVLVCQDCQGGYLPGTVFGQRSNDSFPHSGVLSVHSPDSLNAVNAPPEHAAEVLGALLEKTTSNFQQLCRLG